MEAAGSWRLGDGEAAAARTRRCPPPTPACCRCCRAGRCTCRVSSPRPSALTPPRWPRPRPRPTRAMGRRGLRGAGPAGGRAAGLHGRRRRIPGLLPLAAPRTRAPARAHSPGTGGAAAPAAPAVQRAAGAPVKAQQQQQQQQLAAAQHAQAAAQAQAQGVPQAGWQSAAMPTAVLHGAPSGSLGPGMPSPGFEDGPEPGDTEPAVEVRGRGLKGRRVEEEQGAKECSRERGQAKGLVRSCLWLVWDCFAWCRDGPAALAPLITAAEEPVCRCGPF